MGFFRWLTTKSTMPTDVASSQLQWQIVKNHSAFLVKRDGLVFSSEPLILKNTNKYKYSGIVNPNAAGLTLSDDRKGLVLLKNKKGSDRRRPKTGVNKIKLTRGIRKSARSVSNELAKYRPDLRPAALARLSALSHGIKAASGVSKKKRTIKKKRGSKK